MNTYTVTRWLSMPVVTVTADSYDFESGFVNFYVGTAKIDTFSSQTVMRVQKA